METYRKIEVMQAHLDGDEIEFINSVMPDWLHNGDPTWDWSTYNYRIKPKETLEDRIKAEYADFDVVMLGWYEDIWSIERSHKGFNCHTVAQSMIRFHGYVYSEDDGLYFRDYPVYNALKPVAVLFSRGVE